MKISKLFHWLYASLMLLPLMVFGVTGLYYGLNQNAQLSERTEQEQIQVNFQQEILGNFFYNEGDGSLSKNYESFDINNLVNGNTLDVICDIEYSNVSNKQFLYKFNTHNSRLLNLNCSLLFYDADNDSFNEYEFTITDTSTLHEGIVELTITNLTYIEFYCENLVINDVIDKVYFTQIQLYYLDNMFGENIPTIEQFNNYFPLEYYPRQSLQTITIYSENPITYTNDISTSVINAWNSTWQNPLFSWSSDSFLIAPFNYITDLFSIPQNNTFSMALSYWLAISIVYLVFDLVMYVPLLAHRWIDKGMVE